MKRAVKLLFGRLGWGLLLSLLAARAWAEVHDVTLRFSLLDIPPYGQRTPDPDDGIYPKVARLICEKAKIHCEISILPYRMASQMLVEKRSDASVQFSNARLAKGALQLGVVGRLHLVILAAKKKQITGTVEVARLPGGCAELENRKNVILREANTLKTGLDLLVSPAVVGFCNERYSSMLEAASHRDLIKDDLVFYEVATKDVYLHVRPDLDPALTERLKVVVKDIGLFIDDDMVHRYMNNKLSKLKQQDLLDIPVKPWPSEYK